MLSYIKRIEDEKTVRWIAAALFAFLVFFEAYLLDSGYSDYFVEHYNSEGILLSLPVGLSIAAALYLFYKFIQVSLTTSWFYKVICFVIFALATLVEFGYKSHLGRFTESFDIEMALMSTADQKATSILMYLNYWALVPCLVFLAFLILIKPAEAANKFKPILAIAGLYVFFFLGFSHFQVFFSDKPFPTVALNAFVKTSADFVLRGPIANGKWASGLTGIKLSRRDVAVPKLEKGFAPSNNIVVVMDESVRGDHFSLNGYDRETTPFLERLVKEKILHNWGITAAASTGSIFSYNVIMTGLTPDDFPERTNFKINTTPTLFQYAKAMKYKTHFFDGQMKTFWGGIPEDKKWIDQFHSVEKLSDFGFSPSSETDNRIAKEVSKIIAGSTGNFIVIFKHGSHIPYQNNFPRAEAKWKPSYTTTNKYAIPAGAELNAVKNAYDNSIRYNVNRFFENLIADYSQMPNNSVILYTGDHGQTLFVGGKTSHGGITKAEANVPLFVIGNLDSEIDTSFKASHQNIFPTVLDLMSYPAELRSKTIGLSLLKATSSDSKPRYFNPDLGIKIPFDD